MSRTKQTPFPQRTEALAEALVDGLTNGIPLRELCRKHEVGKSTVYDWIDEDEAFAGRIALARTRGFDVIAEEALEIADDGTNDYMLRRRPGDDEGEGDKVLDTEHVQRSKLRIETRLKLLAKWDPKRYGDKLDMTSGGKPLEPSQVAPVFNVTLAAKKK